MFEIGLSSCSLAGARMLWKTSPLPFCNCFVCSECLCGWKKPGVLSGVVFCFSEVFQLVVERD